MNSILPTNCPNCGSPLPLSGHCEYCGTNVRLANQLDAFYNGEPVTLDLRVHNGDNCIIIPLVGNIDEVNITRQTQHLRSRTGILVKEIYMGTEVDFSFHGTIDSTKEY